LKWTTASELNNKGFDIQRSVDGSRWESIAFVNGAGQSDMIRHYSYRDLSLPSGRYFYRLMQMDFDGQRKSSNVEVVNITGNISYEFSQNYPNPFRGTTSVELFLPEKKKLNLSIYDANGRMIKSILNESRDAGYHLIQFNADDLSPGIFYLRMETDDYRAVKKITIK